MRSSFHAILWSYPDFTPLELFSPFYEIGAPVHLAATYTVGLVITLYNRPAYLARTLRSLERSDLGDTVVMLVDDASDDPDTLRLVEAFNHPQAPVIKARRVAFSPDYPRPHTISQNLLFGWSYLAGRCRPTYLSNLDADMVVKRDWLRRLVTTHRLIAAQDTRFMLTGFNTLDHYVVRAYAGFYEKLSLGGANLFFRVEDLVSVVQISRVYSDDLTVMTWDWSLVRRLAGESYRFYAARPSVAQHIGGRGVNSDEFRYDFALDYYIPYQRLNTKLWRIIRAYRYVKLALARARHTAKQVIIHRLGRQAQHQPLCGPPER